MSEEHKGQIEEVLSDLGRKIDELIMKANSATGDVKEDIDKKIIDLKARKKDIEDEYQKFKTDNEDKWEEVKSHLMGAAAEFKMAAEAAFRKKD